MNQETHNVEKQSSQMEAMKSVIMDAAKFTINVVITEQ